MTPRLTLAIAAVLLAGCDAAAPDPPPSTFDATYRGGRSGTLAGTVYAAAFAYGGLGTRDLYQIQLDATPAGDPPFTGGGITFQKEGLGPTVGTYDLGGSWGPSSVAAWITLDGGDGGFDRSYYATAGTLRVERAADGRLVGTFAVSDSFLWSSVPDDTDAPTPVAFEGRFEVTPSE